MADQKPDAALMHPGASPLSNHGGRRVNKKPLLIILGILAIFVLTVAYAVSKRAEESNKVVQERAVAPITAPTTSQALAVIGENAQVSGEIAPVKPQKSAPAPEPSMAKPFPFDGKNGMPTPIGPDRQHAVMVESPDEQRANMQKAQLFEQGLKSRTGVAFAARTSGGGGGFAGAQSVGSGSTGNVATNADLVQRIQQLRAQANAATQSAPSTVAAYNERLSQISAMQGQGAAASAPSAAAAFAPAGVQRVQFSPQVAQGQGLTSAGAGGERWAHQTDVQAPRTSFELRAGFVIPATLITGINSELPGQILGQVAQNVFDTATGKHLLIPQGSRLVGVYSSDVVFGQSRVLIAWQRIVFPDGKALDIGEMPGSDSAGYSGFKDQVNNHLWRIYGSALLMSGVVAGVAYSQTPTTQSGTTSSGQSAQQALSNAVGQQLGQVTAQMISKNLGIAPTLEIRPGYRFNVVVVKDLTFSRPYKNFDY